MAKSALRIKGQAEVEAAFQQVRRDVLKELRPALREIGELVRADAAARFVPYDADSAAGYKVRVRMRGVAVEQTKRRTTGLHPQYGVLQMERALMPALEAKQHEVVARVELLIDSAGVRAGF